MKVAQGTLAILLLSITFLPSASAEALDSNSKIRLDRAKAELDKVPIKPDLRKNVPVARAQEVSNERRKVTRAIRMAESQFRMAGKKSHPDMVAFAKRLEQYRAYKKELLAVETEHENAEHIEADLQRVERANKALAKIKVKAELRKNVPVARAAEVSRELNLVGSAVREAQGELHGIHVTGHAKVVACKKAIASHAPYLQDLRAVAAGHEKIAKANAPLRAEFFKEFWGDHATLANYYGMLDDANLALPYGTQDKLAAARTALARIHAGCTGRFKQIAGDVTSHPNDRTRQPALMCRAAAQGDEIVKRRVLGMARYHLTGTLAGLKEQLANIATCDGKLKVDLDFLYDPKSLRKLIKERYGADLAFVGASVGDELFAELDQARAALLAEIPKHVAGWKFGGYGSKASDSYVSKTYKRAHKGLKVKQIQLLSKGWTVKLDYKKRPKYRFKRGGVLYQLPGESWCHDESFIYYQDYKGGGKYAKTYYEFPPKKVQQSRIVSCK